MLVIGNVRTSKEPFEQQRTTLQCNGGMLTEKKLLKCGPSENFLWVTLWLTSWTIKNAGKFRLYISVVVLEEIIAPLWVIQIQIQIQIHNNYDTSTYQWRCCKNLLHCRGIAQKQTMIKYKYKYKYKYTTMMIQIRINGGSGRNYCIALGETTRKCFCTAMKRWKHGTSNCIFLILISCFIKY